MSIQTIRRVRRSSGSRDLVAELRKLRAADPELSFAVEASPPPHRFQVVSLRGPRAQQAEARLARLVDLFSTQELLEAVDRAQTPPELEFALARVGQAASDDDEEAVLACLQKALSDESVRTRRAAVVAMARPSPRFIEVLRRVAEDDPDHEVQGWARLQRMQLLDAKEAESGAAAQPDDDALELDRRARIR